MNRLSRLVVVAAAVLSVGACSSGGDSSEMPYQPSVQSDPADVPQVPVTPDSQSGPREPAATHPRYEAAEPAPNGAVRVHGRVVYAGSGEPYAGAWVEFKDLAGENVHTTTNSNGYYSLPVPQGVYTALAGDQPDANLDFSVSNLASNAVSIPPDDVVNFVVTPTG
jgi:Carboxypeptidase regulatory-like domain